LTCVKTGADNAAARVYPEPISLNNAPSVPIAFDVEPASAALTTFSFL
jgi:hypothetical protein